eukprot:TRINITY_DN15106_c0_g1_i3.p1 TRINITY_DN15106_c0_g1~~TRINITY_DN15106_c0_g1_i3.p1  ORF type:complete len:152 (+),score=6.09 TRINITY_DN15106_c0_g1_i3:124-579(+)
MLELIVATGEDACMPEANLYFYPKPLQTSQQQAYLHSYNCHSMRIELMYLKESRCRIQGNYSVDDGKVPASLFLSQLVFLYFFHILNTHVLCVDTLSLIHISEPTRPLYISYAVFCLKKKKKKQPTYTHTLVTQTEPSPRKLIRVYQETRT